MYTRCPHCLTVFVVAAEQLKTAHGNVRCGTCLESFDAIPHLSDGPMETPPAALGENYGDADARIASAQLSSTLQALQAAASPDDDGCPATGPVTGFESDGSATLGEDDDSVRQSPLDDGRFAAEGQIGSDSAGRVSMREEPVQGVDGPLPEVLREQAEEFAAAAVARRRNIGYGVAAVTLLMLLAAQYVFFMPEDAARRYPQWRGAIESVCVRIGCVLAERRDPARIRVLSRDVRVHPRYEGVMQIKATLSNAAPYRQPYPQVRFTLFNVNGQTIATRVFQPSEYLGRAVAASARIRPRTPFQLELDVLAPEQAAVSFEFQFL
ncbi:MAG: hypothetical protein BMS9Abin14_088 [Gammaproteobacteria bacterium]|nr:MAG: hypothetical protein BMS9Abin14_088 [Gammaproteobacteria bacterium]